VDRHIKTLSHGRKIPKIIECFEALCQWKYETMKHVATKVDYKKSYHYILSHSS